MSRLSVIAASVLAIVSAQPVFAQKTCTDLGIASYNARWGVGANFSSVLRDMLGKTGWRLDYQSIGPEPLIRGHFNGSVRSIIESMVDHVTKSGASVDLRYYPDECRVRIAVKAPKGYQTVTPVLAYKDSSRGESKDSRIDRDDSSRIETEVVQNAGAEADLSRRWVLLAGEPIHVQLDRWAKEAGWSLGWKPNQSWVVPASVEYVGSFEDALASVIKTMRENGVGVRLVLWLGNRYAEVEHVGN